MITSLWNKTEIYCAHHDELCLMDLNNSRGVIHYACHESFPENKKDSSCLCKNTLSLKDFEKMLDRISEIMLQAELNNEVLNLENVKFSIGQYEYKIFKHDEQIKIAVKNKRLGHH